MTILLTLPAPPSVNALWRVKANGGRVRTKTYSLWASHAKWRLEAQNPGQINGPVIIIIGVERSNDRADIDNRIKPTLDLLVSCKVIRDDSDVIGVAASWSPTRDRLMRIAIVPAQDLTLDFHLADTRHGGWVLSGAQLTEEAA